MALDKTESEEILIGSMTGRRDWPIRTTQNHGTQRFLIQPEPQVEQRQFNWTNQWTGKVLKTQLVALSLLAWLLVTLYASNLPVKTSLSSELVPLWSLWVVAMYAMGICIGMSFHFYPSTFGILVAAILQVMTLAFSSYFELVGLTALEMHGSQDQNDTTRAWGALLYSTVVATNGAVIVTSLMLIFISFRDVCKGKTPWTLVVRASS